MSTLQETPLASETLYRGSFIDICRDRVRLPNGHEAERVVVRHPGAACVLAVTADKRVVLVRQWRHPTAQALLEVPAGKLDAGEDPAVCALRELAEETPYRAERVETLAEFYTAPGFCDEKMHLYRAVNISADSTLQADEDEFVETVLLDRAAARRTLDDGSIRDAKTLIALQFWLAETA